MTDNKSQAKRDAALRTANGVFAAWEKRTQLVKDETAAYNAATDAKTARLKALRLEKERQEAEAAADAPAQAAPAAKKTRVKRILVS